MHPLPTLLPTCCRTLAVSSGKVITSATQAANPAEKILTPMVGCASAAVAPSILAQMAGRGAGAEEKGRRGEGGSSALSAPSAALSHPVQLAAGSPVVRGGHSGEEERRSGAASGSASLPTFSPGTPTAPRLAAPRALPSVGDLCSPQPRAAPRQISKDPGLGPAGRVLGR